MIALVLQHHPHRALAYLRRKLVRRLVAHYGPYLSGVGASGKPGAVHGAAGELLEFEASASTDGERRCLMRAFPYPGGVALIAINRSGEMSLRRRLSEKASFKAAVSGLHEVATLRLNVRGVIIAFDERFEEISGFQNSELRDCRLSDIFRPIERRQLGIYVEQVLQGGSCDTFYATLLAKNGEERGLELSLAPIIEDGISLGLVAAARVAKGLNDAERRTLG